MTLRIQGHLGQEGGESLQAHGLWETVGWPQSPSLAREQLRPHQGALLSNRSSGRKRAALAGHEGGLSKPTARFQETPKDGLFQHGPGPAGPLSGLQTARRLPTAGLLQGLGWEAARAQGGAWALEPSDLGLHLSDL